MFRYLAILFGLLGSLNLIAQTDSENTSVKLSAVVQAAPPRITIQWAAHPGASSVTIYRKLRTGTSWGSAIATVAASTGQYQDNAVSVGVSYEYKVTRTGGGNFD